MPHEPVDGQDAARRVLPLLDGKDFLHVMYVLGRQPAEVWAGHEVPGRQRGEVDAHAEDEVGDGEHQPVHEEREAHAGARHRVLVVGGEEHSVGEVHGDLAPGPLLEARGLGLEVVEAHDLVHVVYELGERLPPRPAPHARRRAARPGPPRRPPQASWRRRSWPRLLRSPGSRPASATTGTGTWASAACTARPQASSSWSSSCSSSSPCWEPAARRRRARPRPRDELR
mmetsp:Transcript_38297/g.77078  ORF Transcript_38297/g.77078 Transcript_38297/m.77078 type:complete len:228 (-) Transcript_38297:102-785(-)